MGKTPPQWRLKAYFLLSALFVWEAVRVFPNLWITEWFMVNYDYIDLKAEKIFRPLSFIVFSLFIALLVCVLVGKISAKHFVWLLMAGVLTFSVHLYGYVHRSAYPTALVSVNRPLQ